MKGQSVVLFISARKLNGVLSVTVPNQRELGVGQQAGRQTGRLLAGRLPDRRSGRQAARMIGQLTCM